MRRLGIIWCLVFAVFIGGLFCWSCGSGGDEDRGQLDDTDDDAADDDVDIPGDDDDQSPVDNADCGDVLQGDLTLAEDLDCRSYTGQRVLTAGADGITIDCAGHRIWASTESETVIFINDRQGVAVKNCELVSAQRAVTVQNGGDITISDNTMSDFTAFAVMMSGTSGFLISDNTVDNEIEYQAGIEIIAADDGEVTGNTVAGAKFGGIQFYGASDIELSGNVVYDMGDTGFGFFSDPGSGDPTSQITSFSNEAYNCGNVGGNEIMHGSHDLTFSDNYFHDSNTGFMLYEGVELVMQAITIENNTIENNQVGLWLINDATGLTISGNTLIGNEQVFNLGAISDLTIENNDITGGEKLSGSATVLVLKETEQVVFRHNVILDYQYFMSAGNDEHGDFSENYWNGCPDLGTFNLNAGSPLNLINPINSLECHQVNIPIYIEDNDGDGFDDQNCERAEQIECLDR